MWRLEGPRSWFRGATVRIAKRSLSTASTWTLFEELLRRGRGGDDASNGGRGGRREGA
jgi:hypothetical protein